MSRKAGKTNETHQNAQVPPSEEHFGKAETSLSPYDFPKIALLDGMVLVQRMAKKLGTIISVKDLGPQINDRLLVSTTDLDQVILVFDTYKADSMKQKTREKQQQGKHPIQYHIPDTNIEHIPMRRLPSYQKMKADLTYYLAKAALKNNVNSQKFNSQP